MSASWEKLEQNNNEAGVAHTWAKTDFRLLLHVSQPFFSHCEETSPPELQLACYLPRASSQTLF